MILLGVYTVTLVATTMVAGRVSERSREAAPYGGSRRGHSGGGGAAAGGSADLARPARLTRTA